MTWLSVTFPVAQLLRVDLHLELLVALPQIATLATPGHAHQPRAQRPARDHGLLDRRERLRREADHQHAARRGERLQQRRRPGDVRERVRLGQALLDELAGAVDVGARLEDEHDRRQAGQRLGADDLHALDAVEQVRLERNGDQLLDLVGRQAERLGLDLHVGRRELRQHVDRRVAQLHDAYDHHAHRHADDQQPETQARSGRLRGSSLRPPRLGHHRDRLARAPPSPRLGPYHPCPCREPGACTLRASAFASPCNGQAADLRDRADLLDRRDLDRPV